MSAATTLILVGGRRSGGLGQGGREGEGSRCNFGAKRRGPGGDGCGDGVSDGAQRWAPNKYGPQRRGQQRGPPRGAASRSQKACPSTDTKAAKSSAEVGPRHTWFPLGVLSILLFLRGSVSDSSWSHIGCLFSSDEYWNYIGFLLHSCWIPIGLFLDSFSIHI